MKALRRFTVRAALPEPLQPLADLARNLRWSWHADSLDLFAAVDPDMWESVGHDPTRLLGEVSAERLSVLAHDRRFSRRLNDAAEDLSDYLTSPRWYQSLDDAPQSIAYFSPEFGIAEALPQYSGGLGILAGDHLKAASDLGVPIIGVGLLYRRGYFTQSLSGEGWQLEQYPPLDPAGLPIKQLRSRDRRPVEISVALPGRVLHAQVWLAEVGRVPLLMLDSDVEANVAAEREVTDRLYGGGSDHRLAQEILLGVGGVRAVRAYCAIAGRPAPEVFHTNEGHAGFLGLERVREYIDQGLTFDEALEATRAGTVFTTHTSVPAGIDRFPRELMYHTFAGGEALPGVPVDRILALGAEPAGDSNVFNMAVMGLRLGQRANGVSRLHGDVSRGIFAGLWPGFDRAEVPIGSVTNGVHAPTWVAREVLELAEREFGLAHLFSDQGWQAIDKVPDTMIWETRRVLRARLVEEIRRRVRESWLRRGASETELGWTATMFDPDVLTIGFARRVPSYKRLTLMLRDPDRLRRILLDPDRPVQFVIAGKAHPADDSGKALIQRMVRFTDDPSVRHRIAFLPDYGMAMARYLYAGCDVWLNNPLRPLEACGTSGMKSALNGGLNLSVRDGWWDEWYDGHNGWAIPSARVQDPERRDDLEAAALYDLVENQVRARYYDRDARHGDLPVRWIEMVRHTLITLSPKVLATRMVRDYVTDLYLPAAAASRLVNADQAAGARRLADWKAQVRAAWPSVAVEHVETERTDGRFELGDAIGVRVVVDPGGLEASDLAVQVAYGRVDNADQLEGPTLVPLSLAGELAEGKLAYDGSVSLDRTGSFGYTVRLLPADALLGSPAELGLIRVPDNASHALWDTGTLR